VASIPCRFRGTERCKKTLRAVRSRTRAAFCILERSIWYPGASGQLSKVNGGSVMAYDLDSMHELELAENHAFRRLYEMADLEDWEEAFGAWLKAVRILRRERVLSRVL